MYFKTRIPGTRCPIFRISLAALAVSITLMITACGRDHETVVKAPVRTVNILTLSPAENAAPLEFPATIRARNSVELAFNVPGQVNEFPVLEGAPVRQGEFLASLDQTEFKARLQAVQAALELAQTDFERYNELSRNGAVAIAELDQKRAALQAAKSDLELVRKNFEDTVMRAPFDGVVAQRLVQRFSNVQNKQPVLVFQALAPLDVIINVPEPLVLRSVRGRESPPEAVVRFDAMNGLELPAELREVTTEADPQTQTFRVVFSLQDTGPYTILPGMSALLVAKRAESSRQNTVFVLPPLAIGTGTDGSSYVWLFDPATGQVRKQSVKVGLLRSEGLEVLSGLTAGDQVVVTGISQLKPGMQVRPTSF